MEAGPPLSLAKGKCNVLRRFFLAGSLKEIMTIGGSEARHMLRVLRLSIGAKVILVDSEGQAAIAEISGSENDQVQLNLIEKINEDREASVVVRLAQGLPKSDKMDYIVQKAVELGVSEIIPLVTDECVVKYDQAKQQSRRERWQKIAFEAAKQCRRTKVPVIAAMQDLAKLLTSVTKDTEIIILYEGQTPLGLKQALEARQASCYLLVIGPEGGFSNREVALAEEKGACLVTMGPRILRTETAAVAALTAVMYHHGDIGG